jgi:hypothetical protein
LKIVSIKRYFPVAGLAFVSRILLEVWPVEAVHASQSALLRWPVFLVILLLGFPAVHFAETWGVLPEELSESSSPDVLLKTFLGGALLGILLVVWDIIFVLPGDMNVLGVNALPFYTAGAFLVEVIQHIIPLVIWLGIFGQLMFKGKYQQVIFWIGALIVAAFEPLSQLGGQFFSGYSPAFYAVGALIIYGINLVQLYIFRHNGFAPMFVMRLGMYSIWHMIWGLVRLRVLF